MSGSISEDGNRKWRAHFSNGLFLQTSSPDLDPCTNQSENGCLFLFFSLTRGITWVVRAHCGTVPLSRSTQTPLKVYGTLRARFVQRHNVITKHGSESDDVVFQMSSNCLFRPSDQKNWSIHGQMANRGAYQFLLIRRS